MNDDIQKDLQHVLDAVKSRVKLQRLFLFGSFAYGQPSPNSDLDLCIVAETGRSRVEVLREIRTDLYAKADHPLDFIFFTPEEFSARARVANSLEWQIEHKGHVIYG